MHRVYNCQSKRRLLLILLIQYLQFLIVKENRGNEGTCVGVSRYPVKDYSHRTTGDMWLYRLMSHSVFYLKYMCDICKIFFVIYKVALCIIGLQSLSEHTVATYITMESSRWHYQFIRRVTTSPAFWIWMQEQYHLGRIEKSLNLHLKMWTPLSFIRVLCSTAVTQENEYVN